MGAAAMWGVVAGAALFVGALIGWFREPPKRLIASLTAFGGGILVAVAAYELLADAVETAALTAVTAGFVVGAVAFTLGLLHLDRAGARHRKRSAASAATPAPGGVITLATTLDTIPEALIIGIGFSSGERLGVATVVAIVLANIPEALASTMQMKLEGRTASATFGVWAMSAIATGAFAAIGYALNVDLAGDAVGFTRAIAGGALLVYVADYVLPEALVEMHEAAGLTAAIGFLVGLLLIEGAA